MFVKRMLAAVLEAVTLANALANHNPKNQGMKTEHVYEGQVGRQAIECLFVTSITNRSVPHCHT